MSKWLLMTRNLLLVGSIPLNTVEEVFRQFGGPLGNHLTSIPDGEVGIRKHWVSRVHYQVLAIHPDIEIVRRPRPDNGVERLNPHDASDSWQFRVRAGAGPIRFGEIGWRLGFARDALASYFVFRTFKEKGLLRPHLRFQVSLPSPISMLPPRIFPDQADVEKILPGLTDALRSEIETITAHVPNDDLSIQFDCATEIHDVYGSIQDRSPVGAVERSVNQFLSLSPAIPTNVNFGFHLCFGTLGGWPRFQPETLGSAVSLANNLVANTGRRVDWVHIPTLDNANDSFFEPLRELKPQNARVYLGLIHNMPSFKRRLESAKRHLNEFGIAAYCGFGRVPTSELAQILNDHIEALKIADATN